MTKIHSSQRNDHTVFHLNAQILADSFADIFSGVTLLCHEDPLVLDGVRLFQPDHPCCSNYIYLLPASQITENFQSYQNTSFIVAGKTDYTLFSPTCVVLQAGSEEDLTEIMNQTQQIFEKYRNWDLKLQLAIGSVNPLDEMLTASLEIFHNPVFAHDINFYILSCPLHVQGMSSWEKDPRTGRVMVSMNLIHEFKVDMEYLRTLNTKGPDIYSQDLRGYQILYMNLWNNGSYQGRICIDELQSPIMPGHFAALEYLGSFIELCIQRHNLFHLNMGNDTRQFFTDFLDGTMTDSQKIHDFLYFLNWNWDDRYLCLRLETEQSNERMHSGAATLGHIEAQIPEGCAFLYQQGIAVIINLSYEHSSVSDVISGLAIILREGLFKMGVSTEIHDFMQLPLGYRQSVAALKLGKKSGSMIWCYRFDDYILEYVLESSLEQLPPELLCPEALLTLKKYDKDNNTHLFHTLHVYLNLERNVLQTAKALFIHRSTLFYRLERIQKLTRTNLDDPRTRLSLQLSYCLLEQYSIEAGKTPTV